MPNAKNRLQVITLTPELATDLLERNGQNRPLSDQHVKRIANQIRQNKWRFNGDTIKIASTNDVLDGQHRLWAVIEAKKPVETVIVYGIEKEAFSTIDTISRQRSGADVLSLAGLQRHTRHTAEAIKWLLRWQRKCLSTYRAPQNRIENSDVEEAFAKHPTITDAVERVAKLRRIVNPSIMGFLFYVIYNRDAYLAERLVATLENPARVALTDPIFKLRQYLTSDHERTKDPLMTIALAIKAVNAAKAGKKMERLAWRNQGDKPETFPVLEG